MKRVLIFVIAALILSPTFAKNLKFYTNGSLSKIIAHKDLLKNIKIHEVEYYNKKDRRSQKYKAFLFNDVLDYAYGKNWKSMKEVSYTCKNGFKPIRELQRLSQRRTFLAFKRLDLKNFVLIDKTSNNITQLGPYYLTWEERKGMTKKEKALDGWVYQVTGVDILDKKLPITPDLAKDHAIFRGYKHVKEYCIHCHTINGFGGSVSFDFNRPNIITKNGRKGFEKYIKKELSNRRTRFNKSVKNKKQALKDMADFLEYIGLPKYQKQRERLNKTEELNRILNLKG